jgi:hypothetical protein
MGETRSVQNSSLEKPDGKRSHERPSHGWEDDIQMVLK